ALEAGGERGAKCSERWLGTPVGEVEAGLTRPLRHRLILEREPRDEAETGASDGLERLRNPARLQLQPHSVWVGRIRVPAELDAEGSPDFGAIVRACRPHRPSTSSRSPTAPGRC